MIDLDALRAHVDEELKRWNVPAMELAIVQNGETLLADGFGVRNVARGLPATPTTRFHHGSTGKAFTGVLAGTLVDEGLLEWNRPVRDYLPEFRPHESVLGDRITTADLLSHRSGLARHELAWLANPSLSRGELVRRLRYMESKLDLRAQFEYSNIAYMTVGYLIGCLTGSTWEEQMRLRVLEPAGMTHTVTSVFEAQELEDHAQPYREREGKLVEIPWRKSDTIAPAGGMMTCAVDIARWLRVQLGGGEIDDRRIISAEALAETRTIHTPIEMPGPDPDIRFGGYAFGWVIGTYRGHRLAWHNGGIDGFKTEIAVFPDDNIAVAASSNVLETNLPLAVVFHTIDLLLGAEPKPWTENFQRAVAAAPKPPEPRVVPDTHPSHPLEEYAGEYEHPGYGTLTVEQHNGDLRLRLCEIDLGASYRHFDTWTVSYESLDVTFPLTFVTDPDGRIAAAEMPLDESIRPIRFEARKREEQS